jgi:tetratricopeptide (TPR) repeat protein
MIPLLINLADAALRHGDSARATALLEESMALRQALGSRQWGADELGSMGQLAFDQGDVDQASALYDAALALAREMGDRLNMAWMLIRLSELAYLKGDDTRARALLEESLQHHQALGQEQGIALVRVCQGYIAHRQVELEQMAGCFAESLAIYGRFGNSWGIAVSLIGSAGTILARGERLGPGTMMLWDESRRAARLLGAADALLEAAGARLTGAHRVAYAWTQSAARAQFDDRAFADAREEGRTMTLEQAIAYALSDET